MGVLDSHSAHPRRRSISGTTRQLWGQALIQANTISGTTRFGIQRRQLCFAPRVMG